MTALINALNWLAWNTPYCVDRHDVTNQREVFVLYERAQQWKSAWVEIDKDTEQITAYGNTRWKERYTVPNTMAMPVWAKKHLKRVARGNANA